MTCDYRWLVDGVPLHCAAREPGHTRHMLPRFDMNQGTIIETYEPGPNCIVCIQDVEKPEVVAVLAAQMPCFNRTS